MKNKLKYIILLLTIATFCFSGCTENDRAKNFGGNASYTLPSGTKLVNVTWKETDLWILTRQAKPNESPETYELKEYSSFGIFNGTVTITEQ